MRRFINGQRVIYKKDSSGPTVGGFIAGLISGILILLMIVWMYLCGAGVITLS